MRKEDKIDEDVWNFLLTGGYSKGSTTQQVILKLLHSKNKLSIKKGKNALGFS